MYLNFRVTLAFVLCLLAGCGGGKGAKAIRQDSPLWTDAERRAIKDYWTAPGRYSVVDAPEGPRVNVSVAGSTWYLGYTKILPTQPKDIQTAWQDWLKKRIARDRASAAGGDAPDPGAPPSLLAELTGEPPVLFEKVTPRLYTIRYAPQDATASYGYTDAVSFGDRPAYYPYLRSANGVRHFGRKVKDFAPQEKAALAALFARVTPSPGEQRVMQAVSALEGGWDAINTYDTGWVSIGFIQFITTINGNGSLAQVLARHKADDPTDFAQTFHRFGLDVTPGIPSVAVINPATGEEKRGTDAVRLIIDDKRLTSVFQRAGERDGFRRAQIAIARARYWPGDDTITVTQTALKETVEGREQVQGVYFSAPGAPLPKEGQAALDALPEKQKTDPGYRIVPDARPLTIRVGDVFKSEAGLATLMDRKVNRGNLGNLNEQAARLMQQHSLKTLADLTRHERELVAAMKYRHDFLGDPTLSQPGAPASSTPTAGRTLFGRPPTTKPARR